MTYNNVPPTAVQNQHFQQQQRHNFNYNLPQQPPVGIEVVDETPMESLQQAAVEMSRPREAITYYPGLTRKQQQRKALRSAKVREKSLTLYNRKQKNPLTETNAPPVGVLRAIGADVPAIEAGHLRLAIQDVVPHWDARPGNTSAPLAITNDVLQARNAEKTARMRALPAIKWLDENATPQLRSALQRDYIAENGNSIVDNLNSSGALIQKRPKYLGRKPIVNFEDLNGPELLEHIKVQQLAGVKRKSQTKRDSDGVGHNKTIRRIEPTNYNPYAYMDEVTRRRDPDRDYKQKSDSRRMKSEFASSNRSVPQSELLKRF